MKNFLLSILKKPLFTASWFVVMNVLLLMPAKKLKSESFLHITNLDKLVHFCLYGILSFSFALYVLQHESLKTAQKSKIGSLFLLLSIVHGLEIEFLQKIPSISRDFSWYDFLFDTAGVITGWILAKWLISKDLSAKEKPL